jgi:hypothetical protein
MNSFNPDYVEMLNALSDEKAEFLLVGAFALSRYGLSRSTGDMDVWVRPDPENATRVWKALLRFGAPLTAMSVADFFTKDIVYQVGVAPCRIDFLTSIDGVEFDEAWEQRTAWTLEGRDYPVIGRLQLIKNKLAVGRLKDLADAQWLEQHGA